MFRTSSKIEQVRKEIRKEKLSLKLKKKRLRYLNDDSSTEFQMSNFSNLLKNHQFTSSETKVFQTLEDYEITKVAFKSPSDYMVTQDRNGFVIVKDNEVIQIKSAGKNST